jgi:hypothetical protein
MDETLELERYRELEALLATVASKARIYGRLSTGLLVTAGLVVWVTDRAVPSTLAWSFLCFGVLFGIQWINFAADAVRARVELAVHLAKCQVLGGALK